MSFNLSGPLTLLMRTLFLVLTLLPSYAQALERDITNALETVGGIYSSIYIHELGHALAYKAFGATDIVIEVPPKGKILGGLTTARMQVPFSPGQNQINAVSGLLASSLAGEIVIQRRGLHDSPYAQAVLGASVVSNLRQYICSTTLASSAGMATLAMTSTTLSRPVETHIYSRQHLSLIRSGHFTA